MVLFRPKAKRFAKQRGQTGNGTPKSIIHWEIKLKTKIKNEQKKSQTKTNKTHRTKQTKPPKPNPKHRAAQTSSTTIASSEQLVAMKEVPHTCRRHSPTSDLYPSTGQIPPQGDTLVLHRHLSPMLNCRSPGHLHSGLQHNHCVPKIRQNEFWSLVASMVKTSKQLLEDLFYVKRQVLLLSWSSDPKSTSRWKKNFVTYC